MRFSQVYYRERVKLERYFANIVNHNRSELGTKTKQSKTSEEYYDGPLQYIFGINISSWAKYLT